MSKTVTSACVIIPPKRIWPPIQEIRRKYDKKIDRWMPHINLLYPFRPKEEYEKIERDFKQTLKTFEPFEIWLKSFKFFRHKFQTYTIWLNPVPEKPIIQLQRALLRNTPECNNINQFKGGFNPHLSVGQFTTYKIHQKLEKLQTDWEGLRFMVNNIYFISRKNTEDSAFQIEKQFPL
ncbi:MAG: 2'-5' RNA ligase family protein [Promethearchaeota archaeon]|nr:MAG: 2'-5' RNA ligase family protein [Candidatus Lokiarchaeota archaeon]